MPELDLLSKGVKIVRGPMDDLERAPDLADAAKVNRAILFADQEADIEQGKSLASARFGHSIAMEEDIEGRANGSEIYTSNQNYRAGRASYGGYTTYVRPAEQIKIDQGFYPFISTGLFPQIVGATATLFTQEDQHWDWLSQDLDDTGQPMRAEDVADAMMQIRQAGNFFQAIETVDYVSSSVETAVMHLYLYGFRLWYDPVLPTNIYFVFGERVTEYDEENNAVERAVNPQNIDDASIVVIRAGDVQTASDDGNTKPQARWMAYVGANETPGYELGRFVTYTQADYWPIPELGSTDEGVYDYRHIDKGGSTGPICNPLTYVKEKGEGLKGITDVEYPVSILRGGVRKVVDTLMPTSTSLYESCLEIELAWSRLLHACSESMSGINVIGLAAGSVQIPKSLKVPIMRANQTFQHIDTATGLDQSKVLEIISTEIAQGRNVPGYMVTGSISATPEAGIHLAIQTGPLKAFRAKRKAINQDSVDRVWKIERGIIGEYRGAKAKPLIDIEQTWAPGTWSPPRDEATRTAEIVADREAGLTDHVESVRRKHHLKNDAEAEELIAKYALRDKDYEDSAEGEVEIPPPGTQNAPPQLEEPPDEPDGETEEDEDGES